MHRKCKKYAVLTGSKLSGNANFVAQGVLYRFGNASCTLRDKYIKKHVWCLWHCALRPHPGWETGKMDGFTGHLAGFSSLFEGKMRGDRIGGRVWV